MKELSKKELTQINGGYSIREFGAWCKRFYCSLGGGAVESGRMNSKYILGHPGGGRP